MGKKGEGCGRGPVGGKHVTVGKTQEALKFSFPTLQSTTMTHILPFQNQTSLAL